jgi:hypothetical protein
MEVASLFQGPTELRDQRVESQTFDWKMTREDHRSRCHYGNSSALLVLILRASQK